jgi:metal-sulfur cluster biosynthetic enzyme
MKPDTEEIYQALSNIVDPEMGLDFVELGLIYQVESNEEGGVTVTYTLTSPMCPIVETIGQEITEVVSDVKNVVNVEPKLVWLPQWQPDFMSDDAKFAFGF